MKKSNENGFSLVELMVVIGVLTVLLVMAVPHFDRFEEKAKTAEAATRLSKIRALQKTYHVESNHYLNFGLYGRLPNGTLNCDRPGDIGVQTLGVEIAPCGGPLPRYGYSVTAATTEDFLGKAETGAGSNNSVCKGKPVHYFTINAKKELKSFNLNACD